MFTKLSDVRKKAVLIVVGKLSSAKAGPIIDVEYSLRGNATRGRMQVAESPDGHVWVPANKSPRVVAFIDRQNRFRWIGRLMAGPSLETGVIKVEGFFDFNAHIVGPGVMTMAQLRRYLARGSFRQRFRLTLTFPDGKGGLRRSKRTLTVGYDPFKRKATVYGARWACLGNPQLLPLSWGRFSLRFYCRGSRRRLSLDGPITGMHKTGVILADVTPSDPVLYRRDFDRYVRSAKHTRVQRVVRIVAGSRSWRWILDKGIVDAAGRLHKARGASTSGTSSGKRYTSRYTYRFRGITLSITTSNRPRGNFRLRFVQWADAGLACTIRPAGSRALPCRLRPAAPIWK